MPDCLSDNFVRLLSRIFLSMFLVCKLTNAKRQSETDRKKVTEKELSHLNNKIDKLLIKLEDESEPELATSPEEECVICISAKATMQTYPCGHRVVCRKCFVKTIQMVVSQRMLPLRCVICRSKILRLKQTTHGGLNAGHVLRNSRSYANTNPFYISPANSPVSPVTEVFREQRAVFVRHYVEFGYDPNGQSPVSSPCEAFSRSGGSNCVLHKHCIDKHNSVNSLDSAEPGQSQSQNMTASQPKTSPDRANSQTAIPPNTCPQPESSTHSQRCPNLNGSPFQWQFSRKRKYSRNLHRHRRHGTKGRPNSLLLPIDEREELQESVDSSIEETDNKQTDPTFSSTPLSLSDVHLSNDIKLEDKKRSVVSSAPTSRFSTTLMKAKNWIKRGKLSAQ